MQEFKNDDKKMHKKKNKKAYREQELMLKRQFQAILWVFFPINWCIDIIDKFSTAPSWFYYYYLGIQIFQFVLITYFYLRVTNLMRNYHNFEFQRNSKAMSWFFWTFQVANLIYSYMTYIYNEKTQNLTGETLKGLYEFCNTHVTDSIIKVVFFYVFDVSFTFFLIMSFAVIYLKSEEDLLENVSTLNYLLKVSVFQQYRGTLNASSFLTTATTTDSV